MKLLESFNREKTLRRRLSRKGSTARITSALLLFSTLFSYGSYAPAGGAATLEKSDLAKSLAASPLTEEQRILHVLNRLGYGPRLGDVERVKSVGLSTYISQQLNPQSIDDSALEKRLESLETIHLSSRELAERYYRAEQERKAQRREPPTDPKEMKNGSSLNQRPEGEARTKRVEGTRLQIGLELQQAKILRATYSERQLQEIMTDFWFNHFNVFMGKGADRVLTTEYEREVIRPNALGNFHELLVATAKSPAMLFYLDNWMSVDPNAERFSESLRRKSVPQNKRARGLNENYARELMELHTLGVDGGYTQKDVTEVARCFTGWTMRNPRQGTGFQFANFFHDNGEKTVLGKKISAGGGIRDGEIVLEMLSSHPSTAHFIATKLCRRFVSDNPPEALVKRCADTFQKTRGDIRETLATIFSSPEFYSVTAYRAKMKKPFELLVSALRAAGAETEVPPKMVFSLRTMGEMLYGCQPPTGYADTADAWINSGALLERVNFATHLANGQIPRTRTRLDSLSVTDRRTSELIASLSRELLGEAPKKEFVRAIEKQVDHAESAGTSTSRQRIATIAGMILGSPEFQKR